jgi:hypothetical protein
MHSYPYLDIRSNTCFSNHILTAIAASAPIFGFPGDHPPLDGGLVAITRAASHTHGGTLPGCQKGILAVWPLIAELSKLDWGLTALSKALNLCTPMSTKVDPRQEFSAVIEYLQSVFFLLAEGNYPFPTNYITFSALNTLKELQGWPMRAVCQKVMRAVVDDESEEESASSSQSRLRSVPKGAEASNESIRVEGHPEKVKFDVVVNNKLRVSVDWQDSTSNLGDMKQDDPAVVTALKAVKAIGDAVNVFYNVSGTVQCNNVQLWAPAMRNTTDAFLSSRRSEGSPPVGMQSMFPQHKQSHSTMKTAESMSESEPQELKEGNVCTAEGIDAMAAWGAIVCNEEINLVQYMVKVSGISVRQLCVCVCATVGQELCYAWTENESVMRQLNAPCV